MFTKYVCECIKDVLIFLSLEEPKNLHRSESVPVARPEPPRQCREPPEEKSFFLIAPLNRVSSCVCEPAGVRKGGGVGGWGGIQSLFDSPNMSLIKNRKKC